ncbi:MULTISPECIES: hypothetical protein [Micrococcaceae]|nr:MULTISPECIES: hypothetical protein [Micrococcaceae]PCC26130.1 hypothetical protein CIK75_06690 [Glutamicibacter sp. BW78]
MSERFEWEPDLARGEWLRTMEAESFGSLLSVVPRGFEAYARVFHPVERDRPRETKTWLGLDESAFFEGVQDIGASLETERATWADAASSFKTTMHAEAQYASLLRREYGHAGGAIAADGWRYGDSFEGCLDVDSLAAAAQVLARHTSTPDSGIAAIWEGWGGLVSSAGVGHYMVEEHEGMPVRYTDEAPLPLAEQSLRVRLAKAARHWMARMRSLKEALPRRQPKPGSGLLAREIATGKPFELHGDTGRSYILFEAGADDFADAAWPTHAPWVDEYMGAQSPSILWPDDHSWVLATEIDFDSTLIAGTAGLIRELERTPGLEVLPIHAGAGLSCEGDAINRPQ